MGSQLRRYVARRGSIEVRARVQPGKPFQLMVHRALDRRRSVDPGSWKKIRRIIRGEK